MKLSKAVHKFYRQNQNSINTLVVLSGAFAISCGSFYAGNNYSFNSDLKTKTKISCTQPVVIPEIPANSTEDRVNILDNFNKMLNEKCPVDKELSNFEDSDALEREIDKLNYKLKEWDNFTKPISFTLSFVSFVGLVIGVLKYLDTSEVTRKQKAHDLIIRFLESVYQVRLKMVEDNNGKCLKKYIVNYVNYKRTGKKPVDEQDLEYPPKLSDTCQYHINHVLNLIEEICVAIAEGVIDEDIVIDNCIIIFVEYYTLFEEYIKEHQALSNDANIPKKDAYGYFCNKIDEWRNIKVGANQENLIEKFQKKIEDKYKLELKQKDDESSPGRLREDRAATHLPSNV